MTGARHLVAFASALCVALVSRPVDRLPEERTAIERLRSALPSTTISDVRIAGNLRWVSPEELKRAIAGRMRGGFFQVDIASVRASALEVPWVRDVSVRRVWPGELRVTVVEDRPIARWAGGGLVTDRGTLLPVRQGAAAGGLPLFDGPREAIPVLRDGLRAFSSVFDGIGGGIGRLKRSAAGNWTLEFTDGVALVFRDEQTGHVRRFAAVYLSTLIGRRKSIERIDFRYPNGFAVRWRSGGDAHSRVQG